MQTLPQLVLSAQNGDLRTYDQIVFRFQDRAVSYAYSLLGDFQWAEDAAQEAFMEAFCCLPSLQEPLAFPGWLRRIVFKHCDRLTRKKKVPTLSLEAACGEISLSQEPHTLLEKQEAARQVRDLVALLPERERSVTLLFYLGGHSQAEIAEFLEVPVTTIKKRLYAARLKMKERMIALMAEELQEQRPSRTPQFAEGVSRFTTQFSQMINTGQSLVRSLAALAEQEPDAGLSEVYSQMQREITGDGQQGATLSEAMSKHPEVFSPAYINAIQEGEVSGSLAVTLQRLGSPV